MPIGFLSIFRFKNGYLTGGCGCSQAVHAKAVFSPISHSLNSSSCHAISSFPAEDFKFSGGRSLPDEVPDAEVIEVDAEDFDAVAGLSMGPNGAHEQVSLVLRRKCLLKTQI